MPNKFIQNVSANTFSLAINQAFGLIIFYILSRHLDKAIFGNFNWALAVLLTAFSILSFGIDQIVIKKIATGESPSTIISVFLQHVIFSGIAFYALLIIACFIFPSFFNQYYLLLFLGFGKLLNFFSTPFKQLASGLERFPLLMVMTIGSTVIKGGVLFILSLYGKVSIYSSVLIFIAGDIIELVLSVLISVRYLKLQLRFALNLSNYLALFKEALPQVGTVIFSSALARLDWILIGLLASASKLAEYSFAYKVFELSALPLLVIAPLLIPAFSRLFKNEGNVLQNKNIINLRAILTLEIAIACLVGIVLNILWVPVIDLITNGEYGTVNSHTIFVLSLCLPFLYFNNFFWTINFSKGRLKMILKLFSLAFAVNLIGNLVLIPLLQNEGAAIVYVFTLATQAIIYIKKTTVAGLNKLLIPLLTCPLCALTAGYVSVCFSTNVFTQLFVSIILFLILIALTGQLSFINLKTLKRRPTFS
jgi:O-antigen/teichoic acid export membrane protein